MNKLFLTLLLTGILNMNFSYAQNNKSSMDTFSYSLGVLVTSNLKSQGFEDLDNESFTKAVSDVLSGNPLAIDVEQANTYVSEHMQKQMAQKEVAQKEKEKEFFEANAKKQGVKTTDFGLQYIVLESGTGKTPGPNDNVTVHYTGTLIDGTKFDSSIDRNEPATFPVNGVIQGWTKALQMMKEGDKWRIFIPYSLGYGERGAGGAIPPYSTLIFDVELISVN